MDAVALRAEFPALTETTYLNAGTCGPLPRAAVEAATAVLEQGAQRGRAGDYMATMVGLRDRQREAYAGMLGAAPEDVALVSSTSDGVVRVLAGLSLGPGDEVLTAPDEHPGLLGPLSTLRERRGVEVRTAPFGALADAVGPRTRLVACSHVSWVTGQVRPEGLAALGPEVSVLLDGAQGVGAVPVDVRALGCDFYAGSGQKWMCGPVGTGMLWVSPEWRERLPPVGATWLNLADPHDPLGSGPQADARRHDTAALAPEWSAASVAAHEVFAAHGWQEVHRRARTLASQLAERLRESGRTVAERDTTTLVSWEDPEPEATRDRLAAERIIIRNLPGTSYVRASVGAWNDEGDLDRMLAAIG